MASFTGDPSLALVPRGVGELLSDAAALLKRILRPVLVMALPFCVVELVFREGAHALLARVRGTLGSDGIPSLGELASALVPLGGYFALVFASFLATQLLGAGAILASSGALFGQRLTPVELLVGGLKKAAPVMYTLLLWVLAIELASALPGALLVGLIVVAPSTPVALVGAALWGAWMLLVVIFLGLRWALWPQALVLEGLSGPRALARSTELMAARGGGFAQSPKFRLSVLMLVYLAVASALQSLFAMPTIIKGLTQTPPFSDLSLWSFPIAWIVPLAAVQVATNAIIMPFNGVVTTLFYFDLRVRYEGFDLGDDEEAVGG